MINVTKLYCGGDFAGDALRYATKRRAAPVVAWNCTARCNLRCRHCYSSSGDAPVENELSTAEAMEMISGLAAYGVPVLLFSGGEPLMRPDLMEVGEHAVREGMRVVLSTNGTLIGSREAKRIARSGFSYAGISLDGLGGVNDRFRGIEGAFDRAVRGIHECRAAGLKTGIRMTLTRQNALMACPMVNLARKLGVKRVCFYHLVYSGRGSRIAQEDLDAGQARAMMEALLFMAGKCREADPGFEILTVDNHVDGVFLYLSLRAVNSPRAETVYELLRNSGGNQAGRGIACIDPEGNVYPDQFLRSFPLGNVRERSFAAIWEDGDNEFLASLRERKRLLTGRCGRCAWQDICNGNMRARAYAVHGDLWAEDPACYLSEEEIAGGRVCKKWREGG